MGENRQGLDRNGRTIAAASRESRSIVTAGHSRKRDRSANPVPKPAPVPPKSDAIPMASVPQDNPAKSRPTLDARSPRVLITAGPTHEPIDRVRYIGNRSSGRMGIALAEACLNRAWPVTLLLGPIAGDGISPPMHPQLRTLRFQTAAELQVLLHDCWPSHDLLLMAAAVADYTIANPSTQKMKRSDGRLTLELTPTPDLLASLAPMSRANQTVVGFALEPAHALAAEAARKLKAKNLDAIVANPLETMDSPDITATLLLADGRSVAAPANLPKGEFAKWLLPHIETLHAAKPE